MDLGLKNKVAVVTGGTLGIGLATALVLWTGRRGVLRFMGSQRVRHD